MVFYFYWLFQVHQKTCYLYCHLLVLSKVIADDNINNMFYGVLGTTNKKKKPYTEVYVFRGEKMLDFIKNQIEADTK